MSTGTLDPDANNAHMLYIPIAIFGVLCPLLTIIRTWSRLRKGGHLGVDDYAIMASLVSLRRLVGKGCFSDSLPLGLCPLVQCNGNCL